MCRYARKIYKSHYACFRCRKSFKQTDVDDILLRIRKDKMYHELNGKSIKKAGQVFTKTERHILNELREEIENRPIKCPECGNLMADLGREFKPPKKTAVKEWKIVEGLYRTGKIFHTCGCDSIGYIPKNSKDYEIYLKNILDKYQNYLTSCQNVTEAEFPDKMERVQYWAVKISKIKTEIAHQKFHML